MVDQLPVSLDDLDDALVTTLLGLLWQARIQPLAANPTCTARAEALVRHLVRNSPPEVVERHAEVARRLVAALDPEPRAALFDELGLPASARRRFVEHLLRPVAPVARAYALV